MCEGSVSAFVLPDNTSAIRQIRTTTARGVGHDWTVSDRLLIGDWTGLMAATNIQSACGHVRNCSSREVRHRRLAASVIGL
jgi:hypothetical protein